MRFQRLHIPAFGPFTNLDLRLPEQPADFHLIFGANEAGKSSLLRAIRDLLFGIHSQSADNFRHDYAELRIRGEIGNRAGLQLVFQRRKGNKHTLLDADGRPLPDTALAPFLGPVDEAYFSAMFGLGARELREGAQQLLRGEGEIGAALFSASLGGTPVQQVVAALQQEADRIFKGRATANVSLRPAVARYKELQRLGREAVVNPETWERDERELAEAVAVRRRHEEAVAGLERELQWIERCEDALPMVGELRERQRVLADLAACPELPLDFAARAQEARRAVADGDARVQGLTAQLTTLAAQLAECRVAPTVLALADTLDLLHQELGAYRAQKKTLGELQIAQAALEPQLRAGMQRLQIGGEFAALASCRLSSAARLACEAAGQALTAAQGEHRQGQEKFEQLQQQIRTQESQLEALPEPELGPLRDALALAAEATDADRSLSASEAEVQRLTREVADQHRQVPGAPADLDAAAGLPIPGVATLRRHQEHGEQLRRELHAEEEKVRVAQARASALRADLVRLQRQGELPSAEALRAARARRDRGWGLVLAEWKGAGATEELIPGVPLAEAFPQTMQQADGISDQLRLQAEAVAQALEKSAQLAECEQQAADAQARVADARAALASQHEAWQAEWAASGINPRAPAEMLEWRDQWTELRGRREKLRTAQEALARKRGQIEQAKAALAAVLVQPAEKPFALLFAAARQRVQEGERAAGRRSEKAEKLAALREEQAGLAARRIRLSDTVQAAEAAWRAQGAAVGLPADTPPEAGLALLRERNELLAHFDRWREGSVRLERTMAAIARFERQVRATAETLGLAEDSSEALEAALWRALTAARQAEAQYQQLAGQMARVRAELDDARAEAVRAERGRAELLLLAGLTDAAALEPLLAHLEQRAAARREIDRLRGALGGLARGQAVDDFVARVRAENPDLQLSRKAAAMQERAERLAALAECREVVFRLEAEQRSLEKAGDAAADYRQQAELVAATLRQDAARFLRLRVATDLLQRQIEQFRKENQGPLLQRSGEIFRAMTRGAFAGLGAEFNADDLPVLVGVRADETKVPVAGLSEGSRDQLFLALRLAALERHLAEHEPMPLILDDLLITFDDERARAILPQLGELARRTQVFLFTHHEHVIELCRQSVGAGQFHLHRLGPVAGAERD